MIPVKLKIKNFMCYRGEIPPFSFNGVHTACICGQNGAGKSALIDAITWALWGKSRAKSDDDVVSLNEQETEVSLDFEISGELYQVIRQRQRPKKTGANGQSLLSLFAIKDGKPLNITGDTLTQTEKKIISILHMDYDTFINSAFLRQGHANQFTQQPPGKRKEVLSNILGLEIYDQLEDLARQAVREAEAKKLLIERSIADGQEGLKSRPELAKDLELTRLDLTDGEEKLKTHIAKLEILRHKKHAFDAKQSACLQIEKDLRDISKDQSLWLQNQQEIKERISTFETLIVQEADILKGYKEYSDCQSLYEKHNRILAKLRQMEKEKKPLEDAVYKEENSLKNTLTKYQEHLKMRQETAQTLDKLEQEKIQSDQLHLELENEESALKARQTKLADMQGSLAGLETEYAGTAREINSLEEKLKLLTEAGESRCNCPLCETKLGQDKLKLVFGKYRTEQDTKEKQQSSLKIKLEQLRLDIQTLTAQIETETKRLNQKRRQYEGQLSVLEKGIADAKDARTKAAKGRELISDIEKQLNERSYAVSEQARLAVIEKEILELNFDNAEYTQNQQTLAGLTYFEEQKRKLNEAQSRLPLEKDRLENTASALVELTFRHDTKLSEQQTLQKELAELPELEQELETAEAGYKLLSQTQDNLRQQLGSLSQKEEQLNELEKKLKKQEQDKEQTAKEIYYFGKLARAFGKKDGIQTMLIEDTLPELESGADLLLSRMTDGRMHLSIETQRSTKKGDQTETLDINISDELGTRNYETFSGGEAFRIDFAVRIALSRLLANRLGAPLRTLIIDEGFGTQDSTGIERLKEAINSIQDEFDKILVITHIDDLKDSFPTRIEIDKTPSGSAIRLN
ncbi:AAA family ATPase [Dehalococcoides mccartyi]|uniref:Nuclease SbcCD subunit C n=1 Tax=Dehalococcoides mccartyi (strain VS) TaxID=311424 RepID=D2BH44_DEHMV|nr:SMC family ATPase [Dehalococcoides mccartyi]ACZ61644.1 ATPase involved in DNA repair [Dehalococcoides mccartyi VS]